MAARKKSKSSAPKTTLKIKVGSTTKTYKRTMCGNKTDITKKAKAIREKGGTARVVKNGTKYCLYKGPRKRKARRA